eukprot:1348446-Pleurochrysis_carterae.AAC.6
MKSYPAAQHLCYHKSANSQTAAHVCAGTAAHMCARARTTRARAHASRRTSTRTHAARTHARKHLHARTDAHTQKVEDACTRTHTRMHAHACTLTSPWRPAARPGTHLRAAFASSTPSFATSSAWS